MKLIFFGKNWDPNQWFSNCEKGYQSLKKIFFEKKNLPTYLCRYDLQNAVRKFFLNKWVSRYLSFGDFKVRKIALHNKTINKTRLTNYQENSADRFVNNYLTNHLAKFLQDRIKPWRVGALRVWTSYHFFKENR